MKNISISPRKAISVLRKDFVKDPSDVNQNTEVNKMFHDLRRIPDYQILLKSGAKMFMNDGRFLIGGYAADGGDVNCYFKRSP